MLSKKYNVQVVPKTREEIFKQILARPRKKYAKIMLTVPKFKPKQQHE